MKKVQRYIEIPECWEEMTEADWHEVLKIRQRVVRQGGRFTAHDISTATARALLRNRGVTTRPSDIRYVELVSRLAATFGWLWQVGDTTISLVYKDTRNLLPTVCGWEGPADHGADLVFGEFRQAFAHLKNYEESRNETALKALAGLLYRPEATEQQKHERQLRRQPYDWDTVDEQIRRGQQMKPWQLWGIYAWFAWFCEYLTKGSFIVGDSEVCFAPLFEGNGTDGNSGTSGNSLLQIGLTLAEGHTFGTIRDVDNTLLLTVMQKLLMDYHLLKKIKAKK